MNNFYHLAILMFIGFLSACQTDLSALNLPTPALLNPQTQSFNDTRFEMKSCEITSERSAICKLTVTNRFRDKKFEIGRGITIQDNLGNDYAVTAGGFGDLSNRPQWRQVAVADTSYNLTVIATNLSTRAKLVRAVIFPRLLVRSTQGQTLGYRDNVIFSKPAMIASVQHPPSAPPTVVPQNTTNAGPSTKTPPPTQQPDSWLVVGYWNYDATDGQHLPSQGLVMRTVPGKPASASNGRSIWNLKTTRRFLPEIAPYGP